MLTIDLGERRGDPDVIDELVIAEAHTRGGSMCSEAVLSVLGNEAVVASITQRHSGGGNERRGYDIPTSRLITIDQRRGCDLSVSVQRTIGTGTIDTHTAGLLTARLYPA
jgi:hypothetical protein